VEASTLQAPAGLARNRIAIGTPLLRLRSDEQLVALFRAGHDEAFRAIHDRYEKRLLAYARQMLPRGQDAEDALQDVFVRAYSGLRSSRREMALRAWLFRVAHNRCIDELRRPAPPPPEVLQLVGRSIQDPVAEADRRESLRRLLVDVQRLPEQQRSALLMREMAGMSYAELAGSLRTSVPAVKSLLVRARIALAQAAAARDTACSEIREELAGAHDRGVRPNGTARRHMRDCAGCRSFRRELRIVNRQLAALAPLGPLAMLTKLLGISGGAGAGGGATASGAGGVTATSGGVAAIGGASGGGAIASGALIVGSGHLATLLAAAVATAGGAVAISAPPTQSAHGRVAIARTADTLDVQQGGSPTAQPFGVPAVAASAAGASIVAQSKAKSASLAASDKSRQPQFPPGQGASAGMIPPTSPASSSSGELSTGLSGSGSSVSVALNGGSDPSASGAPSGTDSTTFSSGSEPQSDGTGGSSSTTSPPASGSSSSGPSATTSSTGSGSSSGTGSGTGTGTGSTGTSSTGTGSSSGSSSSSGSTSSTPTK
jgi:RNA polymerase sigma factor (sigma-70 family)